MTNSPESDDRSDPTRRFSGRADAYHCGRPAYPPDALEALLEGLGSPTDLTVADIGAGTGISSRALADLGVRVLAVEPNAAMREAATPHPLVTWVDGRAEVTSLESQSVDVAVAFQAFHWFDPEAAFAEFRRVARSRVAVVQYERDEGDAFTAAYAAAIRPYMLEATEDLRARALVRFAELAGTRLRRTLVPSKQVLTIEGLIARVESTSYLPNRGDQAEALRNEIRALFNRWSEGGTVTLAMCVYVLVA